MLTLHNFTIKTMCICANFQQNASKLCPQNKINTTNLNIFGHYFVIKKNRVDDVLAS